MDRVVPLGGLEQDDRDAKKLLSLSAILMSIIVVLVVVFPLYVWPRFGLPLRGVEVQVERRS